MTWGSAGSLRLPLGRKVTQSWGWKTRHQPEWRVPFTLGDGELVAPGGISAEGARDGGGRGTICIVTGLIV